MANNSPQFSKTAQLQAMANQHQNSPVTQFVLPALGGAVRRVSSIALGRAVTAIAVAGSAADMYSNYRKLHEPNNEQKQNTILRDIAKEAVVTGLSLTPFAKTATLASFGNNIFDLYLKCEEGNGVEASKKLLFSSADKIGLTAVEWPKFLQLVALAGGID